MAIACSFTTSNNRTKHTHKQNRYTKSTFTCHLRVHAPAFFFNRYDTHVNTASLTEYYTHQVLTRCGCTFTCINYCRPLFDANISLPYSLTTMEQSVKKLFQPLYNFKARLDRFWANEEIYYAPEVEVIMTLI